MSSPRILDLFCGAGGAGAGYAAAGFEVVGVDVVPQPHYPFEFVQHDAVSLLRLMCAGAPGYDEWPFYALSDFAVIHASPVCHDFSALSAVSGKDGSAELLHQTLDLLRAQSLPWVVENVVGAPLAQGATLDGCYGIELCGTMFGLKVLRHRLFESSVELAEPPHGSHEGEFYSPAGHGDPNWRNREANPHLRGAGYADRCREAMRIDWMNRDELSQAIPPAYTRHIGSQLLAHLEARSVA